MNEKHLTNYLKDHFAGSVAAVELLNHLISSHRGKQKLELRPSSFRPSIQAYRTLFSLSSTIQKSTAWPHGDFGNLRQIQKEVL